MRTGEQKNQARSIIQMCFKKFFYNLLLARGFSRKVRQLIDCKRGGFLLKISKEIGKAWRKSLTRAKRASLTRPSGVWGSLSVFSLVPDLLFDCSRVKYAKIRTVLQPRQLMILSYLLKCQIRDRRSYLPTLEKRSDLERNFRVSCNLKTEISLTERN